jgi:hypothetical protein
VNWRDVRGGAGSDLRGCGAHWDPQAAPTTRRSSIAKWRWLMSCHCNLLAERATAARRFHLFIFLSSNASVRQPLGPFDKLWASPPNLTSISHSATSGQVQGRGVRSHALELQFKIGKEGPICDLHRQFGALLCTIKGLYCTF